MEQMNPLPTPLRALFLQRDLASQAIVTFWVYDGILSSKSIDNDVNRLMHPDCLDPTGPQWSLGNPLLLSIARIRSESSLAYS